MTKCITNLNCPNLSNFMTNLISNLLPEGFRDRLPGEAEAAVRCARAMLDILSSNGYVRIAPSIAEFEESMVKRGSAGMQSRLLRFSDPVSGNSVAVRGDITVQVGRIAATHLADAPRPLRLSYHGPVLRLKAAPLRPEREITQIGAELIGNDSVAAASEILRVAIEALEAAGVTGIVVDLTLPDLVETLAANAFPLSAEQIDGVRAELDMKDAGGLTAMGADAYLPLLAATGPFEQAIARLEDIDAGGALASRIQALKDIAAPLAGRATVTLDPTERHGFEYQSWFGFTLFATGYAAALGRGGTYSIARADGSQEVATGFSLYPDPLVDPRIAASDEKRLFLPIGTDPAKAARMRAEGWVTLAALDSEDTATVLNCSHILSNGKAVPLTALIDQ
jgi:ATP phosphoribosyltransferase regulatory subunit